MAQRKTVWEVRFRSPVSDTKGVDTRRIETNSDDEARARIVAEFFINQQYPHPGTRLIFVRKDPCFSEDEMLEIQGRKPEDESRKRDKSEGGPDRAASAAGAGGRIGQ
jgi:hypothetical protein